MFRLPLLALVLCASALGTTVYTSSASISNGGPTCLSESAFSSQCNVDYQVSNVAANSVPFLPIITPEGGTPYTLPGYGPIYGVSVSADVHTQNGTPQASGSAVATWNSILVAQGGTGATNLQATFYVNAWEGEDCVTAPLGCSAGLTRPRLSISAGGETTRIMLGSENSDIIVVPVDFDQPFQFDYSVEIPTLIAKNPREAQWSNAEVVLTGLTLVDDNGTSIPNSQIGIVSDIGAAPEPSSIWLCLSGTALSGILIAVRARKRG